MSTQMSDNEEKLTTTAYTSTIPLDYSTYKAPYQRSERSQPITQ